MSEGEKNPIVTLRAQAEKFDYKALKAKAKTEEGLHEISCGLLAFKDINRMDFVINGKSISRDLIAELYKEHDSLLPKSEGENKDYRPFARKVFKEMFKYAGAQVPSDHILEELVINCNQAGYESIYSPFIVELLGKHELLMGVNSNDRKVLIDCKKDSDSVRVECRTLTIPVKVLGGKNRATCDMSFSLEFTIESQNDKDDVTYKDGKLSLTIPEELKNFPVVNEMQQGKSLFDIIKEIFFQLIEKVFGHTNDIEVIEEDGTITMISSFGKPLKVKSALKEVKPPMNDIKTILYGINSDKKLH
ncbi:hypothetical protein [Wolbachia endosymbiont (group A) of Lasioglossum fulvicorne]|uniref:hypothetical protein n=1 Tax=Wolbachia endosymbiont (group A) of Lasioglossum fulvicorne TaxID=3066201 RepID=UPI00333E5C49